MKSLNQVFLIGNVAHVPDVGKTPSGKNVCSFSLATDREWVTSQGEKKEDVSFHRVIVWDKLADICIPIIHKGMRLFIEGRIGYRKYTSKDGVEMQVTEITADDVIFLSKKPDSLEEKPQKESDVSLEDIIV